MNFSFGDAGKNAENKELFRDLKIMKAGEGYVGQMGKYPVINLTLKSAKQPVFESAYGKLKYEIAEEYKRHLAVLESTNISSADKELFQRIADGEAGYDNYTNHEKAPYFPHSFRHLRYPQKNSGACSDSVFSQNAGAW